MKILLASVFLCLACAATPAVFAAEKVGFINVDGAIGPRQRVTFPEASKKQSAKRPVPGDSAQHAGRSARFDAENCAKLPRISSSVVVYVAPTGATATSAGCFITLAANVAAMAPATTIGARIRFPSAVFRVAAKKSRTKP
jgi:Membrane-bound serine protease (ClpP class)